MPKIKNKKYLAKGKRGEVWVGEYNYKNKIIKIAIKKKLKKSEAIGNIENEANFLKILNEHNIGPQLLSSGENWIMYKFVEGELILDHIINNDKKEIKRVLFEIFRQCKLMDELKINKEEMHRPYKHILVDKQIIMIDFERCRFNKKVHNVTQLIQFITSKKLDNILTKKGFNINIDLIRKNAKEYKKNINDKNYKKIIKCIS